jgi:hypothetical protein
MITIKSDDTFYEQIEDLVWKHDISYMDSVILFCDLNKVEVESVANLILRNENLKGKIEVDAEKLLLLPKTSRLCE